MSPDPRRGFLEVVADRIPWPVVFLGDDTAFWIAPDGAVCTVHVAFERNDPQLVRVRANQINNPFRLAPRHAVDLGLGERSIYIGKRRLASWRFSIVAMSWELSRPWFQNFVAEFLEARSKDDFDTCNRTSVSTGSPLPAWKPEGRMRIATRF